MKDLRNKIEAILFSSGRLIDLETVKRLTKAESDDSIKDAVAEYMAEVKAGSFHTAQQSYTMDESSLAELRA